MQLAFVGSEPEWLAWGDRLAATPGQLVAILPDPAATAWSRWPVGIPRSDSFEELLADPRIDAIFLAGAMPERAARVRRAAQAGRACLCLLPIDPSSLVYHELAMIAEDTGARLAPILPARRHPAWTRLREFVASAGGARAVHIAWAANQTGRWLVAGAYAEAADVLSGLIGNIVELNATADLNHGWLIVQHRAESGATGEIRIEPPSRAAAARATQPVDETAAAREGDPAARASAHCVISAEAEQAAARLEFPSGLLGPATLRWTDAQGSHTAELTPEQQAPLEATTGSWSDAICAAELADWVLVSLERRRAVDVVHEARDELASFKGTMTSCGCALVWLTLLALIVVAIAEGLHIPGLAWLPRALLALMLAFLTLQILRWAFPRA